MSADAVECISELVGSFTNQGTVKNQKMESAKSPFVDSLPFKWCGKPISKLSIEENQPLYTCISAGSKLSVSNLAYLIILVGT